MMYFLTENGNYLTKIGNSLLETETPIYQEDLNFDYVETHSFIFDQEKTTTEFILSTTNKSFGIFDDLTEMKFFESTRNIDKYEVSKGSPYLPYPRGEIESILKIDPLSKDQEVIKMPEINRAWEITTITTNKDSNNTQITEDTENFAWIGAAKIKFLEEYRKIYPDIKTHPIEDLFDKSTCDTIDKIGGEEIFLKQYQIHELIEDVANNPDMKVLGDISKVEIYSKHDKGELLVLELEELNSDSMIYEGEDQVTILSNEEDIQEYYIPTKEQQKEQNIKNFKERALKQFQLDYKAINKKLEQKDDDFYIDRSLLVKATDFIKNNIDPEKYQNLPKDQRLAISAFSSSRNPDLRDHFEVLKNKFKAKPKEEQR